MKKIIKYTLTIVVLLCSILTASAQQTNRYSGFNRDARSRTTIVGSRQYPTYHPTYTSTSAMAPMVQSPSFGSTLPSSGIAPRPRRSWGVDPALCPEHEDDNDDGYCDICGAPIDGYTGSTGGWENAGTPGNPTDNNQLCAQPPIGDGLYVLLSLLAAYAMFITFRRRAQISRYMQFSRRPASR